MEKFVLGILIFFSVLACFGIGLILEKKKLKAKKENEVIKVEPTFD
jgi:hypothetical protein